MSLEEVFFSNREVQQEVERRGNIDLELIHE